MSKELAKRRSDDLRPEYDLARLKGGGAGQVLQAGGRGDQPGPVRARRGACVSRQQLGEPSSTAAPRGRDEEFQERPNVGGCLGTERRDNFGMQPTAFGLG